jgi:XPG N-terminal domain
MGFFYRTIRMVENGIKPVYVFDGKPPELKSGVVSAICPNSCVLVVTRECLVG